MNTVDLVLRCGQAILPGLGLTRCDIAVDEGRIAAILAPGAACPAAETIDISRLVVFPGAIDVHLHLGHGKDISRPRDPIARRRQGGCSPVRRRASGWFY